VSGSSGRRAPRKAEKDLGRFPTLEPPTSIRRDFSHLEAPVSHFDATPPKRGSLALSAVLVRRVGSGDLSRFALDARAGFLLSLIDGDTTVEGLLDLSAMPADETRRLLEDLIRQGLVSVR